MVYTDIWVKDDELEPISHLNNSMVFPYHGSIKIAQRGDLNKSQVLHRVELSSNSKPRVQHLEVYVEGWCNMKDDLEEITSAREEEGEYGDVL